MVNEVQLVIKEVIQRSYNVKSFRFTKPQGFEYKAGQFICASFTPEKGCLANRYLSLSSSPTEDFIEFTKKITESDFSKTLDILEPGDSVRIKYVFGNFVLSQTGRKIAFLSGGIGITPIRSICKYVVDANTGTDMVLVYANRSIKEIVFKEDFDRMQKDYPKLKVSHVLCEPEPGFLCSVGYINAQVIRNEIPDYKERMFYLCGPPAMVDAMKNMLTGELFLKAEDIVTENFKGY